MLRREPRGRPARPLDAKSGVWRVSLDRDSCMTRLERRDYTASRVSRVSRVRAACARRVRGRRTGGGARGHTTQVSASRTERSQRRPEPDADDETRGGGAESAECRDTRCLAGSRAQAHDPGPRRVASHSGVSVGRARAHTARPAGGPARRSGSGSRLGPGARARACARRRPGRGAPPGRGRRRARDGPCPCRACVRRLGSGRVTSQL
jgi:hypothetical protein